MANFICGGEKYRVGGTKLDSICLNVPMLDIPESIEVEGLLLVRKSELHVTLISPGKVAARHGLDAPGFLKSVLDDFCVFVKDRPIELVRYLDEFRFVAENERRTVVVMADVSNLDKFFAQTNAKYGLNLEYPPTHVTLYSLQPNIGIFLTDADDIKRLSHSIPAPVAL